MLIFTIFRSTYSISSIIKIITIRLGNKPLQNMHIFKFLQQSSSIRCNKHNLLPNFRLKNTHLMLNGLFLFLLINFATTLIIFDLRIVPFSCLYPFSNLLR